MKIALFVATAFCIQLFASSEPYAADLKIGAGAAPTENILKPIKNAFASSTGVNLEIIDSGPKTAFLDLDRGIVEAAAAGMAFNDWMALMKKEGVEIKDPSLYQAVTIGKDKVIVFANNENKITTLTPEQLQGIFSGSISSWKEVGGDDQPIMIVWGKMTQGTNNMFIKKYMGDKPVTKDVIDATTASDIRQIVQSNPSAVGIGPQAIADGSIKLLKTPELARDITLVTKGKPSPNVQKLLDFIRKEGQKHIKQ
jgi:phosphate transport system substrate-binding protein